MSIKNLFVQAPQLCGARYADKLAKVAQIVWDYEMEGKDFGRKLDESAIDRIAFMFAWDCEKKDVKEYILQLCHYNVLCHYAKEHDDKDAAAESAGLRDALLSQEKEYPEVAQVLTVEKASDGWWGM